jgi:hypothetical protein
LHPEAGIPGIPARDVFFYSVSATIEGEGGTYNPSMVEKHKPLIRYLFPRLQDVLFLSLLAVVILYGPRMFNEDGDLGRHLTLGRYMLEQRSIPIKDLFSHTMPGAPLVPHEWLAQVLLALAYRSMGLDGDVLLAALVIALTFLLVYRETVRRGAFRIVGLLAVLLAAAASSLHWLARPHIFTFLLIALWTHRLEKFREGDTRRLWFFPLLMWIWANMHGAFIAGFVVLGIYLVEWAVEFRQKTASEETGMRLAVIAATSALATLLNPAGWRLWVTSLGYIGNDYLVSHTVEYMPPDFHHPVTWPFLLLLALSLLALAGGKQLRLRHALMLSAWAVMGLFSARNIPLFAILTAPIQAELLQAQAGRLPVLARLEAGLEHIELQLRGFVWPALGVMTAVVLFSRHVPLNLTRTGNCFDPQVFPVQAVNWLESHPRDGNGFNYFTWGGYLLYRRWPEQKVFIDGQTDFYGENLTREYETAISAEPGWKDVLNKYQVTWAILPPQAPLALALEDEGWNPVYQDGTAVVFEKR